MLTIKNFSKIEGSEFQLSSGNKFLIGIARDEGKHYTAPKMKWQPYVKPENLTLDNFVLELHIQTGLLNAYNRKHKLNH